MSKFYTLCQNNSGGYFIKNDDVREIVVIEANSPIEAELLSMEITYRYSQFCSCCGKRWNPSFYDEDYVSDFPSYYGEKITKEMLGKQTREKSAIIYYLDGRKEIIEAGGE